MGAGALQLEVICDNPISRINSTTNATKTGTNMDEKKAEIDEPSVTALSPAVVATDNDRSPDASNSKVSIRTGARSNQGKRSPTGSVKSTKSTTSDKASQTGSRKPRAQSVDHDTQTS